MLTKILTMILGVLAILAGLGGAVVATVWLWATVEFRATYLHDMNRAQTRARPEEQAIREAQAREFGDENDVHRGPWLYGGALSASVLLTAFGLTLCAGRRRTPRRVFSTTSLAIAAPLIIFSCTANENANEKERDAAVGRRGLERVRLERVRPQHQTENLRLLADYETSITISLSERDLHRRNARRGLLLAGAFFVGGVWLRRGSGTPAMQDRTRTVGSGST